ncbi:MAG TPA: fasciclin domain-containing protein, partial [Kiritimatiellia bacterium]|nr:fasciclin domain-containing protein [Kiritimatiellia bacterium]HMP00631.1 fasciclin domain-containing protein [Kiritimatiellia bacterium]
MKKLTQAIFAAFMMTSLMVKADPPGTIVDIAAANSNFTTLVTALQVTGLDAALQEPGPFTVFAPTDAAFAALPPGVLDALLATPDQLAQVLLYHVASGAVLSGDLAEGPLVMLQGAAAAITLSGGAKIDGVSIVTTDIIASNGVIHVIDEVLLPPGNIVEIAAANPNFSTLVAAVVAAGLADTLANDGPFT